MLTKKSVSVYHPKNAESGSYLELLVLKAPH